MKREQTIPDRWVIVKLSDADGPFEKVLAGWWGGYLDSDYWQFSSKIEVVEEFDDRYVFHNLSGSTYVCYKEHYGWTSTMGNIFTYYQIACEKIGQKLEVVEQYNTRKGDKENADTEEGSNKGEDHIKEGTKTRRRKSL